MKLLITLNEDVRRDDIPVDELREVVQGMVNKMQDPDYELEILLTNHDTIPNSYMLRVNLSELFMPDVKPS